MKSSSIAHLMKRILPSCKEITDLPEASKAQLKRFLAEKINLS